MYQQKLGDDATIIWHTSLERNSDVHTNKSLVKLINFNYYRSPGHIHFEVTTYNAGPGPTLCLHLIFFVFAPQN